MTLVELNKVNTNPYYGLIDCLRLLSQDITPTLLNDAWDEVKNNKEHREMFYSLLFSIGDITNRSHNIFGKTKVDSGGRSERDKFFTIMNWIKTTDYDQFKKFMYSHLFNEFTCFDNLFKNRVVTIKNKAKVHEIYNMLGDAQYRIDLARYIQTIINGNNPFDKILVSKFLTPPRLGIRKGCKTILPERFIIMKNKESFLVYLSALMGWKVEQEIWGINFIGYRNWRKNYNSNLESVLFSSGKIRRFDQNEFLNWLNKLPSKARFRVKNRIHKYPQLKEWFGLWEKYKVEKQQEERELTEKVRQGVATQDEIIKLQKVTKEARVTIGATNFKDLYSDIKKGQIDKLKLETFINKVNLPYNSLVIIDDSGSMSGAPFNFATFIAAVCLTKNPDDDARNLLGFFSDRAEFYGYMDRTTDKTPNSLIARNRVVTKISKPFIDPSLSFYDNYLNIDQFCRAIFHNGSTDLTTVAKKLGEYAKNDHAILDEIKKYPIWTIISDGDLNHMDHQTASLNDFFMKVERYLGFRPFVILIDVNKSSYSRSTDFVAIPNFIHIQDDPSQIEQVLLNFKDIDVMDVYTPLQSLAKSNRYEIIRQNVL
jgi:hypothetical protein